MSSPNRDAIRETWRWLAHAPHGVSEVRSIRPGGGVVGIGFFDDEDAFVEECVRANGIANVYVGIQPRPRKLLPLAHNALRPLKSGAGRKDIEVVTATVIDLDPVRPKDTASSEEELARTMITADEAATWCEERGLVRPRMMMSGNGVQLWFALPPILVRDDNRETVQANLRAFESELRAVFATDRVKVDSIHDLSRIIKVIGTVSVKGDPTPERPHRTSVALSGFDRAEDERLRERMEVAVAPELLTPEPRKHVSLPVLTNGASHGASPAPQGHARRTEEGEYDWGSPVDMCGPVQRLWDHGLEDRSLAIFLMVRFYAHKGLPIEEITDLVLEYDRRGLGKLSGRDGPQYVRTCYEKVMATARDGDVAPPCHALQRIGHCRVNREPGARCEIYDYVFDIDKAIAAIPEDASARELEYRLRPIFETIAHRSSAVHGRYVDVLARRFNLPSRDLRKAIKDLSKKPREEATSPQPEASATSEALEGEVYEDIGCYYTLTSRGEHKVISNFVIVPTMRVETDQGTYLFGEARTDHGTVVKDLRFPVRAFHSRRDLLQHLPSHDLQWTGNDNNAQGLLRALTRHTVPRLVGSTMIGDYVVDDERLWVHPQGVITRTGAAVEGDSSSQVVYIPNGSSLDKRLKYVHADDRDFRAVAWKVFELLPQLNTPEVILPVIGWFFATPMKPRFMEAIGSFPILFLWGSPGSGKSSLVTSIFWPLFGVADTEPYSATETEFALLKILTSTRSVPIFLDEYKPFDMPRHRLGTLHRYLRRLYRGETEERGRPDQTVHTYHLQAPVCVAGESRPSEAALIERLITANPDKTTLKEREECCVAFRALRRLDLGPFASRYIQFCLGRDFDADLAVVQETAHALLDRHDLPGRVAENVTAMLLGVRLFGEFARACGYDALPEDLGIRQAVDGVLADLVEGDHGAVKNALDYFVEMLGVMAVQGELKHRIHYVFRDDRLYIHLESAYDSFRQHCRAINYEGEIVDLKALRRLLHENLRQGGYVTGISQLVYFGGGSDRRRAVGIDLARTKLVEPGNFPHGDEGPGAFTVVRGGRADVED